MAKPPVAPPSSPPRGPRPPSYADAALEVEAQRRYLNYALSVITSRALPDVRDGLKPVQRRILYAMRVELGLVPDAKYAKSAKIVGQVIGGYHPHGDSAAYEAMVRMAQDFVMRHPLVDGQGNFGSADGDAPAAYRYTEAKLRPIAMELLAELAQRTVDFRPNYDGTKSEPVVLPARFPNLLVNGAQGIAVGMATSIPPHNLGEVVDACLGMVDLRIQGKPAELPMGRLVSIVRGPDFPTGGQLLATKKELEAVYAAGSGTLKLRGEWKIEDEGSGKRGPIVVVTSVPYAVERATLVTKIAEVIVEKKLAALVDVRDESTDKVRVVLELRKDADPQLVMAYLFKNTPLQTTVQVNLTCLVPGMAPEATPGAAGDAAGEEAPLEPRRLGLNEMLRHFLEFRFLTITRRTKHELELLQKRIHVLEGFETVFDALDEILVLIRKSDGKADAAEKMMRRFPLSEEQTDAILELKLYRLAKLEIQLIRKELGEKRAEKKRLEGLLRGEVARWRMVRDELADIKQRYADKRRTKVVGETDEPEFQAEDFIVAEDANVVLTAQGWLKRVRELRDVSSTRTRDGDAVLAVLAGSTRTSAAFFSSQGTCYVSRIHDVPPSTGYGDPVQKLFKMDDGERMVAALSFDPRALEVPPPSEDAAEPEGPYALAVTKLGFAFRFSLRAHRDPSTRAGRKFARLAEGDEVVAVFVAADRDWVVAVQSDGLALAVGADEVPLLSGPGKGNILVKVAEGERVVGAQPSILRNDSFAVETDKGKTVEFTRRSVEGTRASRGSLVVGKKDKIVRLVPPPVVVPTLEVT